jgi:putative flippase GtrA
MLSKFDIFVRYSIGAFLAISANIAMQHISAILYEHIIFSMAAGTICGLGLKYWIDKKFIFIHKSASLKSQGKEFTLYSVSGLFTTLIFWGFEISFYQIFQTIFMRDVGAVIGLVIGYLIKYQLDKRFVFGDRNVA